MRGGAAVGGDGPVAGAIPYRKYIPKCMRLVRSSGTLPTVSYGVNYFA